MLTRMSTWTFGVELLVSIGLLAGGTQIADPPPDDPSAEKGSANDDATEPRAATDDDADAPPDLDEIERQPSRPVEGSGDDGRATDDANPFAPPARAERLDDNQEGDDERPDRAVDRAQRREDRAERRERREQRRAARQEEAERNDRRDVDQRTPTSPESLRDEPAWRNDSSTEEPRTHADEGAYDEDSYDDERQQRRDEQGLWRDGRENQAVLGVWIQDTPQGVCVVRVEPDSPAFTAGLIPGDCLERIGDWSCRSCWDVFDALGNCEEGDGLSLVALRNGQPIERRIKVAQRDVVFGTWSADEAGQLADNDRRPGAEDEARVALRPDFDAERFTELQERVDVLERELAEMRRQMQRIGAEGSKALGAAKDEAAERAGKVDSDAADDGLPGDPPDVQSSKDSDDSAEESNSKEGNFEGEAPTTPARSIDRENLPLLPRP